ncbi:unnamed protein product, partial [Dibothriocephalus latus]
MGEGEECEAANYVLCHFKLSPEAVTSSTNLLVHWVDIIETDTNDSDLRSELITLSRSPPLSVSYRLSTDGDAASTAAALSPSASPP